MMKRILTKLALVAMLFPTLAAAAVDGERLYQQKCSVCHGVDGGGGVGIPLHLPDFLAVADDAYFRNTIRKGRPGRVMPAFPDLSDSEVDAIVAYIRSWSKQPAPRYSARAIQGDAARGGQLFASHCAGCHGDHGQGGVGTGVTFSRPREAPIEAPALGNPGFQESVSDAMLKATLLRGRKGTPMPPIASLGLEPKDADDLVAYLRTLKTKPRHVEAAELEPIIQFESSYDLQQTLENLKQAVIGRNFRIIRVQYLEEGLAEPGKEDHRKVMLYFCNFAFLNDALAIDPRVGLFLPCRVTLIDTGKGVRVMSINPKNLSRLFNNEELDEACQRMHDLYQEIIEEATL
ncbi:MAG TPA: c-type cytochrome [Gammaproteobacteria bacterium]|nr:c-type cytochrome [Gammaproteobacteria bacterium]